MRGTSSSAGRCVGGASQASAPIPYYSDRALTYPKRNPYPNHDHNHIALAEPCGASAPTVPMHIHACVHTYMHAATYTYTHTHTHTHAHTRTHACTHARCPGPGAGGNPGGRASWDPMAIVYAVRGDQASGPTVERAESRSLWMLHISLHLITRP